MSEEESSSQHNNQQMMPFQPPANLIPVQQSTNDASGDAHRTPRNMQGLLNFLLQTTANEDRTTASPVGPLEAERREFLMKVFESMSGNVVERLVDSLKIISEVGNITERDDPTDCENAINCLLDLVDQIDISNDFQKIGGLHACKPCLVSPHSGIRWRAAQLIGECSQNNRLCQDIAIESTFLKELMRVLDTDSDDQVRIKALYAISAIVRGNDEAMVAFHDGDACCTLLRALQSNNERLKIKTAFLLSTAFDSDEFVKTQLYKMGFITVLIHLILKAYEEKNLPCLEQFLGALLSLSKGVPEALDDCRRPDLNFCKILTELINTYKDDSACLEIVGYAISMRHILFNPKRIVCDTAHHADR